MNSLVKKLRENIDWSKYRVLYAILFGSALRKSRPRDIDIAVMFSKKPDLDVIVELMDDIGRAIGYSMENIDIVPLNREIPCELLLEIVKGIVLYVENLDEYVDDICRRIMICYDNSININKLKVMETALRVLKERSKSGGSKKAS